MKPHEANWQTHGSFAVFDEASGQVLEGKAEAVLLAAQAPAMARVLAAFVETVDSDDYGSDPPDMRKLANDARAVLRAAGVLP